MNVQCYPKQMKPILKTLSLLIFVIIFSNRASAQEEENEPPLATVVVKTYPLRYLYGVNAGIDLRITERFWIGAILQHHQRDILFLKHNLPFPGLYDVDGYAMTLRFVFQSDDVFFHGPELGIKRILGTDLKQHNDFEPVFENRKEIQAHLAYTLGLRKQTRGLGMELYATGGLKFKQFHREFFRDRDGQMESLYGGLESFNEFWPYVLAGLAFSFGL